MLPDTVQTSPYITCILPGARLRVVYMTDTRGPAHPVLTDPGEAAFGVIGLDRKVHWQPDIEGLGALEAAAAEPVATRNLQAQYGENIVAGLFSRGWLQHPSDLCREYWFRTAQIEVTAHCNWGCRFCPVATDPKPKATMPLSLFEEIISKLTPYEDIKFVTFHFYNEPTLDLFFEDRIRILARYGMKLSLSTNASGLTPAKIKALRDNDVLHHLIVNMPSLDEKEFNDLSGSRTYRMCLKNLEAAISEIGPITLSTNGIGEAQRRNVAALRARFEPLGVQVSAPETCDRAGAVTNEYGQNFRKEGRLNGCSWPVNHAHFSVSGDMFICCNDYWQREKFGNIRDGSIHEVMTSPAAIRLRRRVFGIDEAPPDYICRACHDQKVDFMQRQFRPPASFPLLPGCAAAGKSGKVS